MIYKYYREVSILDDEKVILKVDLPDPGSASSHVIDIPDPGDFKKFDSFEKQLGLGVQMKREKTLIVSTPYNADSSNKNISVDYYINDVKIVSHSEPKSESQQPTIILSIKFL